MQTDKYTEQINNKVLLYSTGNYIQYPVINHNGKEFEKECRFPWWLHGKESACQCRRQGSIPGPGRSHLQLNLCTTTTEPVL